VTVTERYRVRQGLNNAGFWHYGYSEDAGKGDYSEAWRHKDGTIISISWGEREMTGNDEDDLPPNARGESK
jgi:hypothetical protein